MSNLIAYDDYRYFLPLQTRWMDNDVYGHVNNVTYYSYFDTVANAYLIEEGGLNIKTAEVVGFVVASQCQYLKPIAYPQVIQVGLRVNKLGSSSVEYGLAIFQDKNKPAAAHGTFTHVFVNRMSGKSVPIPESLRAALQAILLACD
jgi:acyl-CoA thioester hydrolase